MTKIFHIVSNKEWGGGEQYVFDLASRQLADGISVELFCRPIEAITSRYSSLNIPIHTMSLRGAVDAGSAWRMSRIIKTAGPCNIHAHNFKDAFTAAYARKLSGNPDVRIVMCRHLTRKGKTSPLYSWLYCQLDCLIFDSAVSRDTFLSTGPKISSDKITIVHTSIVSDGIVEPISLRKEFNIPEDAVIGMFHGRHDPEKGLDVLIEAASKLRDKPLHIILIGRGSEEYTAHLRQLISANGLEGRVHLAGFRDPLLPHVAATDFGMLPSIVREGCPLSPMEYMSQGKPVIATNHGGQIEYIRNGENGLLVPPSDAASLAEAMDRLVSDPSLRKQLGAKAQADFQDHLNYDSFYKQISQHYAIRH